MHFNKYFVYIGPSLPTNIPETSSHFRDLLKEKTNFISPERYWQKKPTKLITSLNNKKARRHISVPVSILKEHVNIFYQVVFLISSIYLLKMEYIKDVLKLLK